MWIVTYLNKAISLHLNGSCSAGAQSSKWWILAAINASWGFFWGSHLTSKCHATDHQVNLMVCSNYRDVQGCKAYARVLERIIRPIKPRIQEEQCGFWSRSWNTGMNTNECYLFSKKLLPKQVLHFRVWQVYSSAFGRLLMAVNLSHWQIIEHYETTDSNNKYLREILSCISYSMFNPPVSLKSANTFYPLGSIWPQ